MTLIIYNNINYIYILFFLNSQNFNQFYGKFEETVLWTSEILKICTCGDLNGKKLARNKLFNCNFSILKYFSPTYFQIKLFVLTNNIFPIRALFIIII